MKSLTVSPVQIPELHPDQAFVERRDGLALQARFIADIQDRDQLETAIAIGKDLRSYIKEVESARKAAKEPALRIGARIDEIAGELTDSLLDELDRIQKSCAAFHDAEKLRVQREQEERERLVLDAARKANEASDQLKASAANLTDEQSLNAALEAEQKAKDAEAEFRRSAMVPVPVVAKSKGSAVGKKLKFTVTDIKAIYAHSPHLVKLEPNLAAMRSTVFPGMEIPGLLIEEETAFTIKS